MEKWNRPIEVAGLSVGKRAHGRLPLVSVDGIVAKDPFVGLLYGSQVWEADRVARGAGVPYTKSFWETERREGAIRHGIANRIAV